MDIPHIRTTSIIFSRQPLYMCYRPLWTMLFITSIPNIPHICLLLLADICLCPSHVIGSFVTGTSITSVCQEARPDPVVPPLLRQAMECGGNRDNGDSKWRQSVTRRQ